MKVWLFQAGEPLAVKGKKERLLRTGLMCEELAKRGHDVTWFATTFDHFTKEQLYNKDTVIDIKSNYRMNLIWAPEYKKNISIARIINHKYLALRFQKIAKNLEKPDLIYASFPTIDYAEAAVKYGERNNIPVIIDVRDLWPDIFNHNLSGIKKIIAFPYIQYMQYKTKKIFKKAYAINSISDKIVDWAIKKANREKNEKDKSFYIGYSNKKEIKEEIIENVNKDSFNLCFFGTLNNQFEFDRIVKIAQKVKDYNIKIYVCGTGEEYNKLHKQSENLYNLEMLGWLNKEKLHYVLKNSKIGLAPYKPTFDFQMSVSNKFAEYLSYGLPIVLTSGGYMGELVEENKCGINSNNEDEIAEYIIKISQNKDLYKQISQNSIKLYEEKFIAEKIYSDLVDYLEQLGGCRK